MTQQFVHCAMQWNSVSYSLSCRARRQDMFSDVSVSSWDHSSTTCICLLLIKCVALVAYFLTCQCSFERLSSCNVTMMMIIAMMIMFLELVMLYLSQANSAKPVGQLRGLRGGHARSNWEGHDWGLDGLSCRHEQLSQARNSKSHIGLASPCMHQAGHGLWSLQNLRGCKLHS